ncbi:MAG: Cof-type HAD-IIB family hydrolase [Oscillospiraceae bacterium]|nr:Cof-type HAD-IIB family hydrolase [Oscillospiraceae bacterium]
MKNIKMLVTDLDNTLLRTDKTISDYTAGILNKCRQNGIKVVFATARPIRVAQYNKFTPDAVIADNGAIIECDGKIINRINICNDIVNEFITKVISSGKVGYLTVELGEYLLSNYKGNELMADLNTWNIKNTDFSDKIDFPATKISVECKDKFWLNDLINNYPELHLYTNNKENWCQVMHVLSTKYNAIKLLADRYDYDINEVAAFGDDFNDVEMLKQCGIGVAVANAIDEVKVAADYIYGSNDDDGVAKWIEENIFNSTKTVKEKIIEKLKEKLEPLSYVYALWLEGSDANGTADEYSDIDLWADIADEYEAEAIEATESALREIAPFDYKYIAKRDHPQIQQIFYHFEGTSEYFMIDFCWQLHSRPQDYAYYKNDNIEAAKVIFDKDNIIRYKPLEESAFMTSNTDLLNDIKYKYTQHSRVLKYVRRGQYLEAFAFYQHYVLEPIVCLLRIIYTPAYTDYGYLHISRHIPIDKSERLEYFAKISSLDVIEKKTGESQEWFKELLRECNI